MGNRHVRSSQMNKAMEVGNGGISGCFGGEYVGNGTERFEHGGGSGRRILVRGVGEAGVDVPLLEALSSLACGVARSMITESLLDGN